MRRIALIALILHAGVASAADRVAYVERQVVRYEGDRAVVATELVATVVSDSPDSAAPAVAARTFPSGSYHAGHDCPSCGRSQYVISGGAKGRTHTHTCRYDGTVWYH